MSRLYESHPVPIEVLRQLIRLDVETGRLYWLPRDVKWFDDGKHSAARACATWNARWAGAEALTATDAKSGRRVGNILSRIYKAHRVVFALVHGYWAKEVDHKDVNPSNNLPSNLRAADRQGNTRNRGANKVGSSKYKGVCWHKAGNKWMASCRYDRQKSEYLGLFDCEVSAAKAYDAVARQHHGEFARLNFPEER